MAETHESAYWSGAWDDLAEVPCPQCGVLQVDADGFGVLHCKACGFCTHASIDGDRCGLCDALIQTAVEPPT
jgi:hypothetical protein